MSKVEKTKNNLKVDSLTKDDRSKLYNKFVEHGGKVVGEDKNDQFTKNNSKSNTTSNKRSRGIDVIETEDDRRTNLRKVRVKNDGRMPSDIEPSRLDFFSRLSLWYSALSNGTINFSGTAINSKFLHHLDKYIVPALLEVDTIVYNLLNPYSDSEEEAKVKRNRITGSLSNLDDLEILERSLSLYDEILYNNFLENKRSNTSYIYLTKKWEKKLKDLFKPLYILHPHIPRLKTISEKAILSYCHIMGINKTVTNVRISTFNRSIDIIYSKYYPSLFALMQFISNRNLNDLHSLSAYLNLTDTDNLGYYTIEREREKLKNNSHRNKEVDSSLEGQEIVKEKTEYEIRNFKINSIGVKLIEHLINTNKNKLDDSLNISSYMIDSNDKIYIMTMIIDLLDREYLDLFISNRVKYNIVYDNRVKTDYQTRFSDILLNVTDMNIKFKEYATLVNEIKAIEKNSVLKFEHRTILLTDKNSQRDYLFKNLRNMIFNMVKPLKANLDALFLDKEERERIIDNPNDILKFENTLGDYKKRVNGYTVLKALTEAFYFVSGFYYLMDVGYLFGYDKLVQGSTGIEKTKDNYEPGGYAEYKSTKEEEKEHKQEKESDNNIKDKAEHDTEK